MRRKAKIKQLDQKDLATERERILKEQGGKCPICNRVISDPCLDHEHRSKLKGSGQVRGVLCRGCNVLLSKIENNMKLCKIPRKDLRRVLRRIVKYLNKKQYLLLHPKEKKKTPKLTKSSYNTLKKAYTGKAKFPEFREDVKSRHKQTLTKKLKELFDKYEIEPKFYA